jgi:hypothetical protein
MKRQRRLRARRGHFAVHEAAAPPPIEQRAQSSTRQRRLFPAAVLTNNRLMKLSNAAIAEAAMRASIRESEL